MLLLTASLGDFSNVSWQLLSQWGKKTVNELLVKLALCYKDNFCYFSSETCFIRTSKSYHFELQLLTWSYSLCIKKKSIAVDVTIHHRKAMSATNPLYLLYIHA